MWHRPEPSGPGVAAGRGYVGTRRPSIFSTGCNPGSVPTHRPGLSFWVAMFARNVPLEVVQGCSAPELRVWCVIAAHADENGECWPSQSRIAEILNVSERSVRRQVDGLVDKGFLISLRTYRGLSYRVPHYAGDQPDLTSGQHGDRTTLAGERPTLTKATGQFWQDSRQNWPVEKNKTIEQDQGTEPKNKTKDQPELIPTEAKPRIPPEAEMLHEAWKELTGRSGKLTGKVGTARLKAYREALDEYGFDIAKRLLVGLSRSEPHLEGGYLEPQYAFRPTNFDRFLHLANEADEAAGPRPQELEDFWMERFLAASEGTFSEAGEGSPEVYFRRRALQACATAGQDLIRRFPTDEARALARERHTNAKNDLRESLRKDRQIAEKSAQENNDAIEAADAW